MIEKFWVSLVKNERGQSGNGTLKLTVSEEWTDGIYKLIFCMLIRNHQKLKADQKIFGVDMAKNGFGQSGHGTQKWTDGIKSFFFLLVRIQES